MKSQTPVSGVELSFADYHAICEVQDRYTELLDDGDYQNWLELFSENATLIIADRLYQGHSGLSEYLESRHSHQGKHITGAPLLKRVEGQRCSVEANFIALKRTDAGLVVNGTGRYHDELSRRGGRWLFESRRVVIGARQ